MINIFPIVITAVFFFLIIDFVRRGLLKERYSVLWLAFLAIMAVLSIRTDIIDKIAVRVGIAYPPSLLFLLAVIFILLLMLHFSVVISINHEKLKILAQESAISGAQRGKRE